MSRLARDSPSGPSSPRPTIVNQGASAIARKLLILGGTANATALAHAVSGAGEDAVFSYAGQVERPKRQPLPTRVGGFGGVDGLQRYLRDAGISHVVDATHPFAAQMSRNAAAACAQLDLPLIALTRPAWEAVDGDRWTRVSDVAGAVEALSGPSRRVMLALGRLNLPAFERQPQHHYLLRLVDAPDAPPGFPDHDIVIDRGPFTYDSDLTLLQDRRIEVVVSKNSGGTPARAKIDAARVLGLPVIMIDRPPLPARREVTTPEEVLDWLCHEGTDRGV